MSDGVAEIRTATRVLLAITNRVDPELRDVEELLKLAPECSHLSPDEITCEVVHRVLRERVTGGRQCRSGVVTRSARSCGIIHVSRINSGRSVAIPDYLPLRALAIIGVDGPARWIDFLFLDMPY